MPMISKSMTLKGERCKRDHATADCWKGVVCTACDQVGDPARVCFRACKACTKVHPKGKGCSLVMKLDALTKWLKDQGISPPTEMLKGN